MFSPNLFFPSTAAGYGVPDLRFNAPVIPATLAEAYTHIFGDYVKGQLRVDRLESINELDGGDTYKHPGFDLLNVRYFVFDSKHDTLPTGPNFKEVFRDNKTIVIENLDVKERFYFVSQWQVFSARKEYLGAMRADPQRMLKTAFLQEIPRWPKLDLLTASADLPPQVIKKTNHSYLLKIQLKEPRFMILSDLYYDAHQAYIEGNKIVLQPVNGGLIGIALPAGHYQLDLRFEHPARLLGLLLLSMGLVTLLLVWWIGMKNSSSYWKPKHK
ncbi:MAG: hypothetical protein HQM13_11735 [SAR324 cluster bacterium]|nr:hypothetical protein [SAR324 cluster bacterium]